MAARDRAGRTHGEHEVVDAAGVGDLIAALDGHCGPAEKQMRSPLLELRADGALFGLRVAAPHPAHPAALGSVLRPCVGPSPLAVAGAALMSQREPFVERAGDHGTVSGVISGLIPGLSVAGRVTHCGLTIRSKAARSSSLAPTRVTLTMEPTSTLRAASGGTIAASSSAP